MAGTGRHERRRRGRRIRVAIGGSASVDGTTVVTHTNDSLFVAVVPSSKDAAVAKSVSRTGLANRGPLDQTTKRDNLAKFEGGDRYPQLLGGFF